MKLATWFDRLIYDLSEAIGNSAIIYNYNEYKKIGCEQSCYGPPPGTHGQYNYSL